MKSTTEGKTSIICKSKISRISNLKCPEKNFSICTYVYCSQLLQTYTQSWGPKVMYCYLRLISRSTLTNIYKCFNNKERLLFILYKVVNHHINPLLPLHNQIVPSNQASESGRQRYSDLVTYYRLPNKHKETFIDQIIYFSMNTMVLFGSKRCVY